MPKWNEVSLDDVEIEPGTGRARPKFTLGGGPLKFQLPRGVCQWGVNPEYKSFQVSVPDEAFASWYETLEKKLCSETPFSSNLRAGQMRLKVDDGTLFFRADGTLLVDGAERMKGADVSCIMEIPGSYHFNDKYGLTCRATQVRIWAEGEPPVVSAGSYGTSPVAIPRRALLDDD
jgi:hypothetical protein